LDQGLRCAIVDAEGDPGARAAISGGLLAGEAGSAAVGVAALVAGTRDPGPHPQGQVADHDRVADERGECLRDLAAGSRGMIRIDAAWLAVEPLDMRAGTETALARVVSVFGSARAHHAYLFANRRASRMKVLVHDGFGLWLCARRLHRGQFVWATSASGTTVALTDEQLRALVVGLPWQRLGDLATIRVL